MIEYSIKTRKTIIGFTALHNLPIFKKSHLNVKKNLIKKFIWIKPNGEKVSDNDGHGIYYEGKDKFISKLLKTDSPAHIFVEHW
jgi:hypothetical protein